MKTATLTMGLVLLALAALAPAAGAAEQPLSVSRARLDAALSCQDEVRGAKRTPALLVTGTGLPGFMSWAWGFQQALLADGHASCALAFPANTTGDMQRATEYVVHGVRRMRRLAGRRIAIYGISQGAVLPRLALTYWPSLRRQVTDVVALAGTQHGTQTPCGTAVPVCPPAGWQQQAGSRLLAALNAERDETPGPAAWTTVRTTSDALVVPASGPAPTSALRGAANLVVQEVCPGRATSHIATAFDSVSYAALLDATSHKGPADAARLPASVCATPFLPRVDQQLVADIVSVADRILAANTAAGPFTRREPRLRPPFNGR